MMVDEKYIFSLLGFANLIEMTLLIGSFIAVCKAPTKNIQSRSSLSDRVKENTNETNDVDSIFLYDIDVYIIKQIVQAFLMTILLLTFISFLTHILFSFRYRYSWHRLSTGIAFFCIVNAFILIGVSVIVSCWEDKLRKHLADELIHQQFSTASKYSKKLQIGSAAAAATFGFAACLLFLAEALIRFRRLADKIHL